MAVRQTCLDLLHRLRRYAGDPYSHTQFFSDDDLQDILDRHRIRWRQMELRAEVTLTTGGIYSFTDYFASVEDATVGDWENTVVLQWGDWSVKTPATSDLSTGHWTFTLPPPGQIPPIFLTGDSFDLAGCAAECWDTRASALWNKFDASAQGTNARRSQMYDHCVDRAEYWRCQQKPTIALLVRNDVVGSLPGQVWREGHVIGG